MAPSPSIPGGALQGEHKELDSEQAQEQELPRTDFPTTEPLSHPTAWGQLLTGAHPHPASHLPPSHLTLQSEQFSLFSLQAFLRSSLEYFHV